MSESSDRLECKSSNGNIMILYDEKGVIGYSTIGSLSYDLYDEQEIVSKIVLQIILINIKLILKIVMMKLV